MLLMIPIFSCADTTNKPAPQTIADAGSGDASLAKATLQQLDAQTPIDLAFNEAVEERIQYYLLHRQADIEQMLGYSQLYFPIIEAELDRFGLPLELKYIAVIESGLNPRAVSPSGAKGIWQFLYNTCNLVGLQVDSYIDERLDVYLSTRAACAYIQYLYTTFNDWDLAMAAYVGGPGMVRKAVEQANGIDQYWQIRSKMTPAMANYIPSFIAMNYLFATYKQHHFTPAEVKFPFHEIDSLYINFELSFEKIAENTSIDMEMLQFLNPKYKLGIIPGTAMQKQLLILPSKLVPEFIRANNHIRTALADTGGYIENLALAASKENRIRLVHTVKKGEFYHKIALKYNCTVDNIKAWNNLDGNSLYPGQRIEIWISKTQ